MPNSFNENLPDFFHEFSESVVVIPSGKTAQDSFTVQCILDLEERDVSGVIISMPVMTYDDTVSQIPSVGDLVTDGNGIQYRVIDILPDGTGLTDGELELVKC